jgi:hypothetical protein
MKLVFVLQLLLATVLGGPFAQTVPPGGQGGSDTSAQTGSPQTTAPLPPGAGQPAGLQMSARAGLDGVARVGTWVPLEVELTNGGDDLQGEIQVRVEDARRQGVYGRAPTVYSLPVDLPRKSHKRLTMEVLFPSTSNRLQVTLVSAGQQVLQHDVSMTRVALGDFLCGIVSRDPQVFDFLPSLELAGPQRRVRLAHIQEAQFPNRAQLLSSLDCLILANAQIAALRTDQIEALRVWVAAGGLLVGAGGPTWQKTLAPLPDDLLAVRPTDLATLETLHGLVDVAGEAPGAGPWLVSRGRANGTVVAQQDGVPLLVGRKQGQGTVFYLAFDPTSPALTAWAGQTYLWRYILSHASVDTGVGSTLARPYMRWGRLPRAALSDFESLPKPAYDWVVWGLLGYAVAVGPLSYLMLRRTGRPLLALVSVPALAVAATVVFVGMVAANRESDLAATKATVIRSVGGGLAYSRSYVSIFARTAGLYDVQVPDGALVFGLYYPFPMRSYTDTPHWALNVSEGTQLQVDQLDLADGSLATFALDQQFNLGGQLESQLVANDDQIVGTVTNRFDQHLRGATLLVDMQTVYSLGDMAPGESRSVTLDLPEQAAIGFGVPTGLPSLIYPGWTAARPQDSSRRDLLESIFSSRYYAARMDVSGLTLVGWLDRTPLELAASGFQIASVDYALLVAPVAVGLPEGYEGPLRPSLMVRQHLSVAPIGQQDFGSYTLVAGESISLQFTLPVRPDRLEIQRLAVRLEGQPTGTSGAAIGNLGHLSFFDWRTATWRDWEAHFGETQLSVPERFISAGGDVRVKYTFDPPEGTNLTQVRLSRFDLIGQVRAL